MKQIQLYIEDERVELFKDESIVLTQTVQNVKDVGKVFTPFSRQFTVPASKTNNRIFKHFYNFNITNTLDPRLKIDARIDLNHARFEKGFVKLEGVQMKENRPHAYKITFFGNTTTLKDKFRNDKLDALQWLNNFKFEYNANNIINTLQNGQDITVDGTDHDDAFVVPLITHEDRITYDSSAASLGNAFYQSGATGGVDFQELKPAIRVDLIVKAIQEQYDIQFSDDFFNSDNDVYFNMYMWLHRRKGKINQSTTGNDIYRGRFPFTRSYWGGFNINSQGYTFYNVMSVPTWGGSSNYNNPNTPPQSVLKYKIIHEINPQSSTIEYTISITRSGQEVFRSENVTGDQTITLDDVSVNGTYSVNIETETPMIFDPMILKVYAYDYYGPLKFKQFTSSSLNIEPDFTFNSTFQIPEIKVIDFLSGLFKLFNLVVYVDYEGDIIVKTLDSWYQASDNTFDVTKYVDSTKSTVDVALPYREIKFDFDGKKSFFTANHKALFNYEHGVEHYRGEDDELLSGSDYTIKVPFEHHKFERLYDQNTGNRTDIQWGWSVDDNQQSILGKPLLFYPIRKTGSIGINTPSGIQEATAYHIPSNSVSLDPAVSTDNLNFRAEINEWTGTLYENTLFKNFYQKYIKETFDPSRRLTKFRAKLPMSFLLNFELNDNVIVFGRLYRINSIQTNLATGISNLELINIPENNIDYVDESVIYMNVDSVEGSVDNSDVTVDLESLNHQDYP